jgi:hypothetical protein
MTQRTLRILIPVGLATAALALAVAGCGGSSPGSAKSTGAADVSPPGDIPDNQAYVRYTPPGTHFNVKVPEGWARSASAGAVTFTDKLNSIRLEQAAARSAPNVAAARRVDVPRLSSTAHGFRLVRVGTVSRPAGKGVRIVYLADSKPDPVTGKVRLDAVERYVFFNRGHDAVLTLSGPKGADNVDPWKIVTGSLRWTR